MGGLKDVFGTSCEIILLPQSNHICPERNWQVTFKAIEGLM